MVKKWGDSMQKIYKLDPDDITKIIADHFKVNKIDVTLKTEKVSVGYGMAEHNEDMPVAIVEI